MAQVQSLVWEMSSYIKVLHAAAKQTKKPVYSAVFIIRRLSRTTVHLLLHVTEFPALREGVGCTQHPVVCNI